MQKMVTYPELTFISILELLFFGGFLFINLFIFGCISFSLLHAGFL